MFALAMKRSMAPSKASLPALACYNTQSNLSELAATATAGCSDLGDAVAIVTDPGHCGQAHAGVDAAPRRTRGTLPGHMLRCHGRYPRSLDLTASGAAHSG